MSETENREVQALVTDGLVEFEGEVRHVQKRQY